MQGLLYAAIIFLVLMYIGTGFMYACNAVSFYSPRNSVFPNLFYILR